MITSHYGTSRWNDRELASGVTSGRFSQSRCNWYTKEAPGLVCISRCKSWTERTSSLVEILENTCLSGLGVPVTVGRSLGAITFFWFR
jgi:hypothetical protein